MTHVVLDVDSNGTARALSRSGVQYRNAFGYRLGANAAALPHNTNFACTRGHPARADSPAPPERETSATSAPRAERRLKLTVLQTHERERERAFALAFLDVDVGILTPVLLL